jgi:hypothetical protein
MRKLQVSFVNEAQGPQTGIGGSFEMSLEGDCNEIEVTPNLEYLATFVMRLEGVCH